MKLKSRTIFFAFAMLLLSSSACTDEIAIVLDELHSAQPKHPHGECKMQPVVSVSQFEKLLGNESLVVIDVRPQLEYDSLHISGSINLPMEMPACSWCVSGDLLMELPSVSDLEVMLGNAGIARDSKIVLVTSLAEAPNPPYPLANATRVAITLDYVGVDNVSILDGGINAWIAAGKEIVTEPTVLPSVSFVADADQEMFVDAEYVESKIGFAVIIDARDAEVYAGEVIEPWAGKAGHIPSALSIPTPSVWNQDGTYKSKKELKALVKSVIGDVSKDQEIIVYCGVGGYLSTMYYVLNSILGYTNVKAYDGSAQDWVLEHDMEL